MPTIKIDGTSYEVEEGSNLLQACLNLGLDLPYFCWHPAMGSIGACRQCAVVQYLREEDEHGRIVMGCMTPVEDGAIFSLSGDQASGFREAIVESLMLNHPHDCPVCAEGGECHLQDMTVMVGHRDRHYRGRKNTHRNQYLGPLINHEMNRCIACYRCTRFYRDYAGGTDLAAMAAHDHVYFGRHQEGVLENEFAGNLVEVCPTGVFTDKSLVHDYTRKWDLQSAPSVCVGCGVGCNTLAGERYGKLKRIHNRFNRQINGYFLCDRGRFGGTFVNSEKRIDYPARREADGRFKAVHADVALAAVSAACRGKSVAAIGSPRASLEANAQLRKLVGAAQFCSGMADTEHLLVQRSIEHLGSTPALNPSLGLMESADAVLVLGEDLTHTAPRIALSLRQSVRNKAFAMAAGLKLHAWQDAAIRNLAQEQRSPLHIVAAYRTALADVATSNSSLAPADQAHMATSIAGAIGSDSESAGLAGDIARDLKNAQRPLVICGTSAGSAALVDAAAAIAEALCSAGRQTMLSLCLPECNSMGSGLLVHAGSASISELCERAGRGEIDTLLILENDLYRRASPAQLDQLFEQVHCVVGLDCLDTRTLSRCHWVLPSASFTESEGTLVNSEGRAQRHFPAHEPAHERRPGWQWLAQLRQAINPDTDNPQHFDDICQEFSSGSDLLADIAAAAPDHSFRNRGLKVPRQTHRYSGRTAMHANVSVHEPKQTVDDESPLAFTMEGAKGPQPGSLLPFVWSPGWNSNQSVHKFQSEVGGPLRGGSAGIRLLDRAHLDKPLAAPAPEPYCRRPGEWLLISRPCIFGTDELSVHSAGIGELAGEATVALCTDDATGLGLRAGDGVLIDGIPLELVIDDSLPAGCASFSAGYVDSEHLVAGEYATLQKAVDWTRRQPELIGSDSSGGRHD
jgi:NADH-quinone oxidoreductase subunit G